MACGVLQESTTSEDLMRSVYLSTIAGAAIMVWAAPAAAQAQAEPTVEGYLCTFAGKCGDAPQAELPTREAPATKGFRIAKPGAKATASADVRRGAATSGSAARSTRGSTSVAARPAARSYTPTSSVGRSAEAPRADLMIGFDLNSARITSDGMAKARIFARSLLMPELRGKRFLIEGHTDSLGGVPFNMELSRRRAEAVAAYLAAQGVDRSRVEVRGFGPSIPLVGRPASDPNNRRVEAKLIS
jgi:outer membrane protein OmpA-like peptidoglycan-associated protein